MKTVVHILNTGSYSGAENVVITMIEEIQKTYPQQYEFIYVSLKGPIESFLNKHSIKYEPIDSLSIKNIRKVIEKYHPDIIHAHDYTASIICSVAVQKIPIISHLHNNSPWIKRYGLYSFVYGVSCLRYQKILMVSSSVINEYVFGKFIKKKTTVISNPINNKKIIALSKNAEDIRKFDIVFLGRLSLPKNPLRFVRIMDKLAQVNPTLSAAMIGSGPLQNEVEKAISEYHLTENISLLGFLKNPYGILLHAKVLCLTSNWEGFGLVAVEALSLGIPVVSTSVGGLANLVDHTCGRLCATDDEFTNELNLLTTDNEYWNSKSQEAIKRSKMLDNISEYIHQMVTLYQDICR